MRTSGTGHTRRQLLGAGLAVTTLAGCGVFDDKPAPAATPDALQPLLDEALALAAAYDRAAAAQPALSARLTPLAADHRAHAADLAHLIGTSVPPAASTTSAPGATGSTGTTGTTGESAAADPFTALRAAEQAAQKTAAAACLAAPPDRAGLVGSIAACRATHAEALR
ncbi:hypothetical protein ODJ79_08525 [Actinoplanes sp. KI2]|uniref:hypothetical protein n=1 Tax=Actinoplanes sp. KI2 TaxID=2983315 RepID=UPI0021D614AB|nr:hypothetical protein [Actinoplanes sp. KI2]MCU7723754.1 hypothetical protein [Actinoplanes sp. KI2]